MQWFVSYLCLVPCVPCAFMVLLYMSFNSPFPLSRGFAENLGLIWVERGWGLENLGGTIGEAEDTMTPALWSQYSVYWES